MTSFDLISARRSARPASSGAADSHVQPFQPHGVAMLLQRPHLHISGFDPRAAGGRQAIKVELRGMPAGAAPLVKMQLRSALIAQGASRHSFVRTLRGDWRPVFIEFSSREKEHGQYQIDVELDSESEGRTASRWACTMVILVPRADATLTEIHQTFLSTHKNVRVMADDASIAKVNAHTGGGRLDIDVTARNASITHLNLDGAGKVDMGFSTIAWDEDLIEIDVPAQAEPHPHPSSSACLVNAAPEAGAQRQVRLFALGECVLGRWEQYDPESDVLLAHFGDDGQDRSGLTRRLSGRHAIIRRGSRGFEIEDVSRYGVLLDGVWPGKNKPVPLRLGMRIELSASIKGIVVLAVTALLPHGVILHRIDQGEFAECFYFLEPGRHPGFPLPAFPREPRAAVMPLLFHQHDGFWHLDPVTGVETALTPSSALEKLCQFPRHTRFASDPYPECWIIRSRAGQLQQALSQDMHTA
ncbi:MAG: FHA domain-containing protein [Telluria sp.]